MKKKYHLVLATFSIVAYLFPTVNAKEHNEVALNKVKNVTTSNNTGCSPFPSCINEVKGSRPLQWDLNELFSEFSHEKKHDDADTSNPKH